MGYSGRYHAASLVAVFIALAVGIVIGIGLADDVVSTANQELEDSLRGDLDDAEARAEDLQSSLDRERQFSSRAYPALVNDRLAGSSVAIIGLGGLDDETAGDVERALTPAGAEVAAKAVISLPPDDAALAEAAGPRFNSARRGGAGLTKLGNEIGSGLLGGNRVLDSVSSELFSRFSGSLEDVDRIVFVPSDISEQDAAGKADSEALMSGIFSGVAENALGSVAVERTETDPTTLGPASGAGIATVDHADLTAGQVAIVFSLLGAEGDYGTKEGADSFLPELLAPATSTP